MIFPGRGGWTRGNVDAETQSFRHSEATPVAVESHMEGLGSTLSLPCWNQPWDSSVASLPLNDVREGKCDAGCSGNGDAETQSFRHSEATPVAVESHMEGLGSTLSLPCWNQPWDSSVASLPLNDVREGKCDAGCSGNGDAGTQSLRHSEATPVAVESHMEGLGSTLSLPSRNHRGDSSVASLPLNDVRDLGDSSPACAGSE